MFKLSQERYGGHTQFSLQIAETDQRVTNHLWLFSGRKTKPNKQIGLGLVCVGGEVATEYFSSEKTENYTIAVFSVARHTFTLFSSPKKVVDT